MTTITAAGQGNTAMQEVQLVIGCRCQPTPARQSPGYLRDGRARAVRGRPAGVPAHPDPAPGPDRLRVSQAVSTAGQRTGIGPVHAHRLRHSGNTAFWEFAAVEVLRHAGIRIEELLELTHLSIRQYQRPNGKVPALLVIAPSKTDRERVIPPSAELFAVIAAIIRRHAEQGRVIPLIQRCDNHERRMSDPMPFLFQRRTGAVRR